MKKRLINNWGLKLFSFVFAVLLWLVVVNIDNPVKSNTYDNIQVRFQNANLVTDEGLVYEVLDATDTLSVTVSAPRSYLELLSKDDIVAIADFNNITAANTINITYYSKRYNDKITNFKGSAESVKLSIEPEKRTNFTLKAETVGEVEEGYMLGKVTVDQNQVRIRGPESVVSQVSRVSVAVSVSGTTSDIATYADVKLYDAEDNEITVSSIKKNVDSVKVNIEILKKETVPVRYSVIGTPALGYRQSGPVSGIPSEIEIAGNADVLKNVTQIDIPNDVLSITGKTESAEIAINIKNYLPDGVRLADSEFNGKVNAIIPIEAEQKKELKLAENHILITNVPEGYTAGIENGDELILEVSGLQADVSELMTSEIMGTVDLAAYMSARNLTILEPGEYTIEAVFDFEEGISIVSPVKVRLVIEELED